jgi:hypothetical protein
MNAEAIAFIVLLSKLLLIGTSVDNNLIRRVVVVVLPLVPVSMIEPMPNCFDNSEIASIPAIFVNKIPAKLLPLPDPNFENGPPIFATSFATLTLKLIIITLNIKIYKNLYKKNRKENNPI